VGWAIFKKRVHINRTSATHSPNVSITRDTVQLNLLLQAARTPWIYAQANDMAHNMLICEECDWATSATDPVRFLL
jgi:uncharacterized Fe-S cluster protein YjdI